MEEADFTLSLPLGATKNPGWSAWESSLRTQKNWLAGWPGSSKAPLTGSGFAVFIFSDFSWPRLRDSLKPKTWVDTLGAYMKSSKRSPISLVWGAEVRRLYSPESGETYPVFFFLNFFILSEQEGEKTERRAGRGEKKRGREREREERRASGICGKIRKALTGLWFESQKEKTKILNQFWVRAVTEIKQNKEKFGLLPGKKNFILQNTLFVHFDFSILRSLFYFFLAVVSPRVISSESIQCQEKKCPFCT